MSTFLSPLSASSTSSLSMYPFCNCRYHLTREHLWIDERKADGCVFFIPNPYYVRSRSKSRKTPNPEISKSIINANKERNLNGTSCKSTNFSHVSTPKSSIVPSKFDVWNNIKSSFNKCRKLGLEPKNGNVISSPSILKKKLISPLDQFPFRPMPGSSNQVQLMVNPFASRNKIKAPADELTVMFFEIIDTGESEQSLYLEHPILPESPISPISTKSSPISSLSTKSSPISSLSTKSSPIDNVQVKTEVVENLESIEFIDINPTLGESHNLDDILIADFNEYEFDKMISSLPDVMDAAVFG